MADSIYVKVGNEVEPLDLGWGSAPEYVERIEALEAFAETQSAKDAEQDAAIAEAKSSAEAAVSELSTELGALETEVEGKADAEVDGKGVVRTVNGVAADAAGNVDAFPAWDYNCVSLTLGTNHTMASDGWLRGVVQAINDWSVAPFIKIFVNGNNLANYNSKYSGYTYFEVPCKKGDVVRYELSDNTAVNAYFVNFIPVRY